MITLIVVGVLEVKKQNVEYLKELKGKNDLKRQNKNLGNIDDVLSFLDRLYEEGVLKVDAKLINYPFGLWTFIATNQNSDKIKVAKTVEDRIFYLLCLWYFGTRKVQIDIANGDPVLSKRKLLKFFSADTNKAHWPNCNAVYQGLYKGFDTNAFYGKEHEQMSDERKRDMVRDRFSAILAAGLPDFYSQSSERQLSEEEEDSE